MSIEQIHHDARRTVGRALLATMALLGTLRATGAAGAELQVVIVPSSTTVTVPPGASGTFEVELRNPATNTQSIDVAGFQLELHVPDGLGVSLTDATTATSPATYIFSGNGLADTDFGGSLILSSQPSDLVAFDTVLTPNTFTSLQPGDEYGLGLVSFSVDANAAPGTVPVTIISLDVATDPLGTQISDQYIGRLESVSVTRCAHS